MKWEEFISGLYIEGPLNRCLPETLQALQSMLRFRLPSGYTEFCELLGHGVIADHIQLFCPGLPYFDVELKSQATYGNALVATAEEREFAVARKDEGAVEKYLALKKLLDVAFVFGQTNNAGFFLWDLSSTAHKDDDYDIWLIAGLFDGSLDSSGGAALVGREFRSFVQDFCFARKHRDVEFPNGSQQPSAGDSVFRRFKPWKVKPTA